MYTLTSKTRRHGFLLPSAVPAVAGTLEHGGHETKAVMRTLKTLAALSSAAILSLGAGHSTLTAVPEGRRRGEGRNPGTGG